MNTLIKLAIFFLIIYYIGIFTPWWKLIITDVHGVKTIYSLMVYSWKNDEAGKIPSEIRLRVVRVPPNFLYACIASSIPIILYIIAGSKKNIPMLNFVLCFSSGLSSFITLGLFVAYWNKTIKKLTDLNTTGSYIFQNYAVKTSWELGILLSFIGSFLFIFVSFSHFFMWLIPKKSK